MAGTFRLFIAIHTPPDVRTEIGAVREKLKRAGAEVRWEPDEKLHCTIKFLGDAREDALPSIFSVVEGIACETSSCLIVYRTGGCFPNRRNPRVFWVGIEDDSGGLARLQKRIDAEMVRFGVERESRPFHPHVTLGRVTGGKNMARLLTIMETITFVSRPILLSEIAVVRSTLKPSGSVYTTLQSFPLIGKTDPSEYIL